MEKQKKKEGNSLKRFYSDCVDDKAFSRTSTAKKFAEKNEEKIIRIGWFCKNFDISAKNFKKVIDSLCWNGIILRVAKFVYEI